MHLLLFCSQMLVISFNFDGASSNRCAFRDTIPIFFQNAVFIACMSHLMDNTGML